MKTIINTLAICALLLCMHTPTRAQDPHFSQYAGAPAAFNPAMTGLFLGNYRVAGIYRNQWSTIRGSVPFRTYSATYDMRFEGNGKFDGIGAGITFLSDKAGSAELTSQQLNLSFAYIKALNYRGNHYLSLAGQFGIAQRALDLSTLQFGNQYEEGGYNPLNQGESFITDAVTYPDFSTGALWYYAASERNIYHAGFSVFHLSQPEHHFTNTDSYSKLDMRFAFQSGGQFKVSAYNDLLTSAIIMKQGPYKEIVLGAAYRYVFNPYEKGSKTTASVGSYYRLVGNHTNPIASDALIVTAKAEFNNLIFGLSYDLNISSLTAATRTHGAIEMNLGYIGKFGTRKQNTKYCPSF